MAISKRPVYIYFTDVEKSIRGRLTSDLNIGRFGSKRGFTYTHMHRRNSHMVGFTYRRMEGDIAIIAMAKSFFRDVFAFVAKYYLFRAPTQSVVILLKILRAQISVDFSWPSNRSLGKPLWAFGM